MLLDVNMELKICDFGDAIQLNSFHQKVMGKFGLIEYTPPEMLRGQEYSFEADYWALGIVIY